MDDSKPNTKVTAAWVIHIFCDCPHCEKLVDLTDGAEFWETNQLELADLGTKRTIDMKVSCPKCHKEFLVDLEY